VFVSGLVAGTNDAVLSADEGDGTAEVLEDFVDNAIEAVGGSGGNEEDAVDVATCEEISSGRERGRERRKRHLCSSPSTS
jgi:hypothetical protein